MPTSKNYQQNGRVNKIGHSLKRLSNKYPGITQKHYLVEKPGEVTTGISKVVKLIPRYLLEAGHPKNKFLTFRTSVAKAQEYFTMAARYEVREPGNAVVFFQKGLAILCLIAMCFFVFPFKMAGEEKGRHEIMLNKNGHDRTFTAALVTSLAIAPSLVKSQVSKVAENISNFPEVVHLEDYAQLKSANGIQEDYTKLGIMDPFSQPNIHILNGKNKFDYYASGDGNNDEKIDIEDNNLIERAINYPGSLTQGQEKRLDVDGDGKLTDNDKQIHYEFITGQRDHLPGDWNHLSKQEKIDWAVKRIKQNIEYPIRLENYFYLCQDYTTRFQLNFTGVGGFENWSGYYKFKDYVDNAKENIPLYAAITKTIFGEFHAIPCFLAGSDPSKREDFYFFNYKNNTYDGNGNLKDTLEIVPGDEFMNPNERVEIVGFAKLQNGDYPALGVSEFDLQDSIATNDYIYRNLIRENMNKVWLDFEEYPDTINYEIGEETHPISLKDSAKTNSKYYKKDIVQSHSTSNITQANSLYDNYEFDYSVKDTASLEVGNHKKSAKRNYIVHVRDKTPAVFTNADEDRRLPDAHIGYWSGRDYADPENSGLEKPVVVDNSGLPVDLEWTSEIVSQDDAYRVSKINYIATDKAISKNKSSAYQYVYEDLNVGTNDIGDLENKISNNYPDPSQNYTTLPYTLKKDANVDILIYDMAGKLVYNQQAKGNQGDNEERIDISNLAPGTYIFKLLSGLKIIGAEEFVKQEE